MTFSKYDFDKFDAVISYNPYGMGNKNAHPELIIVGTKEGNKVRVRGEVGSSGWLYTPLEAAHILLSDNNFSKSNCIIRGEIFEKGKSSDGRRKIYRTLCELNKNPKDLTEELLLLEEFDDKSHDTESNNLFRKCLNANKILPEALEWLGKYFKGHSDRKYISADLKNKLVKYYESKQKQVKRQPNVKSTVRKQPQTKAPVKKMVKKQPSTKLKPKKVGQQKLRFF